MHCQIMRDSHGPTLSAMSISHYPSSRMSYVLERKLPGGVDHSLQDLRDMATKQQMQIQQQQQMLVGNEQRLNYMRQREIDSQRLLHLRGQVNGHKSQLDEMYGYQRRTDTMHNANLGLASELDVVRSVFLDKEKEMHVCMKRIEELSMQLEELKMISSRQSPPTPSAVELERLRNELALRDKMNHEQNDHIRVQQHVLSQKNSEMFLLDKRIEELADRLRRSRTLGDSRNQGPPLAAHPNRKTLNVAAVEPLIKLPVFGSSNGPAANQPQDVKPSFPHAYIKTRKSIPDSSDDDLKKEPHPDRVIKQVEGTAKSHTFTVGVGGVSVPPPPSFPAPPPPGPSAPRGAPREIVTTTVTSMSTSVSSPMLGPSMATKLQPSFPTTQSASQIPVVATGIESEVESVRKATLDRLRTWATQQRNSSSSEAEDSPPENVVERPPSPVYGVVSPSPEQQEKLLSMPRPLRRRWSLTQHDNTGPKPYRKPAPAPVVGQQSPVMKVAPTAPTPKAAQLSPTQFPANSEFSVASDARARSPDAAPIAASPRKESVEVSDRPAIGFKPLSGSAGSATSRLFPNNQRYEYKTQPLPKVQPAPSKGILKFPKQGPVCKSRVTINPHALLLDAALEGELDLVEACCEKVRDPSAGNDEGITALHNAVCAGHAHIVQYLVERGCDVNAHDTDGWSPLHCAASCNNLATVRYLVENGAAIMARTLSDNETAAQKCEQGEDGYDCCSEYLFGIQGRMGAVNGGVVYALYNYAPENDDELPMRTNDKLKVIKKGDDIETEWWWAVNADSKQEAYVPCNLVGLYPRIPVRF